MISKIKYLIKKWDISFLLHRRRCECVTCHQWHIDTGQIKTNFKNHECCDDEKRKYEVFGQWCDIHGFYEFGFCQLCEKLNY